MSTENHARESRPELSVIVPCFNEELNVPELCERLSRTFEVGGFVGEAVLVDDGSKDGTAAAIRRMMEAYPGVVIGCFHERNKGIAAGWQTGALASRGRLCATIDADLQYQPEDLLRLRRALYDHSVDVVQGWRSATGRRKDRRYWYSRGFNHLLNGVFAMRLRDNKSGFVMASREVLLDILSHRGTYHYWQSFILVAAHAKGYSYREVETLFEERRQGVSFLEKTALLASARSLRDVAVAAWEYRLGPRAVGGARSGGEEGIPEGKGEALATKNPRFRAYMATFNQTHWMITRDVEHHYEALSRSQWLSGAGVRAMQDEKLRRLVRHAYRNVPYYRARMQERGLVPEDIRSQEDLHKLPLLAKSDIRKHLYFDILSENHDKDQVLRITTSGSTGEPFVCFVDRAQLEIRWAATLRAQEWTGYRFGDSAVRLWHQTLGMTASQVRKERLDAWFCNRTFVPVFSMSDESLEEMVRVVEASNPTLIDGYAEALDLLSRFIASRGGMKARPLGVMSSAQTLPEGSRRAIEGAFGCKVFDKYGSREFSGIAYECEAHAGHHVVGESFIVEILKDGRPARAGETGEVVITDLNNFCMPFLRYRIGDLAVAMEGGECACGRGAPRIGAVEGRVQSIIVGTDGQYLPGTFFAHYLKELEHAIRRYQVVQEERGRLPFGW
ncbi:MAG: glycosyltransferase [Polyangiaceae bacterium]